jgi:N-acetylglucosaminyldiphosphoundecaprenol N-acetyl-beta-D-mannosaminyltransferase
MILFPEADMIRADNGVDVRRAGTPAPPETPVPTALEIDGLRVSRLGEAECVAHILAALERGEGGAVVTPNLDHLRRYRQDPLFRALTKLSELVVADGVPLLWAGRLQGTPLPGRVAGADLVWNLSAGAAAAGRTVFLLGGDPGTAEGAAAVLRARNPGLRIVGCHCPMPGFDDDRAAMARLAAEVERVRPDIVYVALGSPKQELVIACLRPRLPAAWWLGVGVSFSFMSGRVSRAPRWMQRCGLEWIHRLAQEPGRLAKRYLVNGIPFACGLFARSALRRIGVLRFGGATPARTGFSETSPHEGGA